MSVYCMSWVFRHSEATGSARLVLLALADKADDDGGNVYPSQERLAADARLSRATVQRALRDLESAGQIEREGATRYGTVRYRVVMEVHQLEAPHPRGERRADEALGASRVRHEPSKEPSTTRQQQEERARVAAASLPDDFPEGLVEHATQAHRVLVSVAEQHNARVVTLRGVGLAIMGAPGRRFVAEAFALASWAQAPPRPIRDVVGTYRTWLGRAERHAGVELLGDAAAAPAALFDGGGGGNVRPLRRNGRTTPADYQALKGTLG